MRCKEEENLPTLVIVLPYVLETPCDDLEYLLCTNGATSQVHAGLLAGVHERCEDNLSTELEFPIFFGKGDFGMNFQFFLHELLFLIWNWKLEIQSKNCFRIFQILIAQ